MMAKEAFPVEFANPLPSLGPGHLPLRRAHFPANAVQRINCRGW